MNTNRCNIKITPLMIEAGQAELFSWEFFGRPACIAAVYIAMEAARVREVSHSGRSVL
jgi:hypothetical protein